MPAIPPEPDLVQRFGLCQWFHYQDQAAVEQTAALMRELGLRHLRTGISWADFHRPEGPAWYRWVMETLRAARLELLVSIWHTPPSLSEDGSCSGPPRRLADYSDFVQQCIREYGGAFDTIELWNEPNNRLKWNFAKLDPDWRKFGQMLREAAYWARQRGARTVLGGMIPIDHHWLRLMESYGALENVDVIGVHAFPGMWWGGHEYCWDWQTHWEGWEAKLAYISPHTGGRPVWVTETGYATWNPVAARVQGHGEQSARLLDAVRLPLERVYWYCALDLAPHRACIEMTEDGGRVDGNEYHLGLLTHEGARKPAFHTLRQCLARGVRAAVRAHEDTGA